MTRKCLKCDGKFPSEGIHNRICLNCKKKDVSFLAEYQRSKTGYNDGNRRKTKFKSSQTTSGFQEE